MRSLGLTLEAEELKMNKILLVAILFFVGCSLKIPYESSKPYFVVIKNSQMAVSATGFIKKDEKRINLQLFSAGTPILNLHVENFVCSGLTCIGRKNFNKEFFGYAHYESFIDELFRLKPIYEGKNLIKTDRGFEQEIATKNYEIVYRVENGNLYFKDRKNRTLIKLKELK